MGNHISYETRTCEADLGAQGRIKGLQFDHKSRRYAGVPYALPPVGGRRWRKPCALPSGYAYGDTEHRPYDATSFAPPCWQKTFSSAAEQSDAVAAYSEDCLRLNIWTPVPEEGGEGQKWPVYVWLHGGWFQMGDPSQDSGMDPTELISTAGLNAVVVVVGYRLNVFGFLACEALREESKGEAAGNYGLWDQRLALEWIHDNIAAFGGDTGNVTLAGRSAGAYSVHAQVLHSLRTGSNGGRELFHRFFMCSNAIPSQPKKPSETKDQFAELCEELKISENLSDQEKLSRLRDIPPDQLVRVLGSMVNHTFRPVTDDLFIHDGIVEYQLSGSFAADFLQHGYRLLIGEVLNEETLYATYNGPAAPSMDALQAQVHNYYSRSVTDRILKHYKMPESSQLADWSTLFGNIIADGQVRAPSRLLVDSLLSHGVPIERVWRYQIGYRLSFIDEKQAPRSFGVAHAMDKPFWNFSITHGPSEDELRLMKNWIDDLVCFVQNNADRGFGTHRGNDMKVITSEGQIEVWEDKEYSRLLALGRQFAGA
ncbi:uncharacterized protein HMPREF1541_08536 [Cyphellophora europaea CBS 101466]|uniref:Carboxylic ester hydrolase n=1 Tax=Cyphellophora europaea (strain CBS 101466) TaxID=1220924 RepID=W2RKK2_CYPE1|nr:uncharacterized protein HMPREF1541_08536 [Cyphellophora europaea CBS 101466]ETN36259.1 hypothetical protein HMPREF1541_08536 [Cyphellophora europaea CBS 101466]